jgi:hypothetical protein
MGREEDVVSFEGVVVKADTDKAALCVIPGYDEEFWIPKSQIHDDSEVWHKGDEGKLVITQWIAEQKRLV